MRLPDCSNRPPNECWGWGGQRGVGCGLVTCAACAALCQMRHAASVHLLHHHHPPLPPSAAVLDLHYLTVLSSQIVLRAWLLHLKRSALEGSRLPTAATVSFVTGAPLVGKA